MYRGKESDFNFQGLVVFIEMNSGIIQLKVLGIDLLNLKYLDLFKGATEQLSCLLLMRQRHA